MPSGHGHSSGGHFGGGSFRSHSGGHFGGSRSSGSRGISFGGHGWHHPHVMFFFGRPVYMTSGRAGTVSVLGVLMVFAIIAAVLFGIGWYSYEEDLTTIREDYARYHQMAQSAAEDERYQIVGKVTDYAQYDFSGKYCIWYEFDVVDDGYSYYVYSYDQVRKMQENGVLLALNNKKDEITYITDSVPLDFKDTVLEDDVEYVDYLGMRDFMRMGTLIAVGITVALILIAVLVPLTAKKATAEQIAESKKTDSANTTDNQNNANSNANSGTWRCRYCNTVNDASKQSCEGCGAKRQN